MLFGCFTLFLAFLKYVLFVLGSFLARGSWESVGKLSFCFSYAVFLFV